MLLLLYLQTMFPSTQLSTKKKTPLSTAQSEVTEVYEWSRTWKLNLNAHKSECYPFSTWFSNRKWCSLLTIGGQQMKFNDTTQLLGIILDCSLFYKAHVKHIKQSLSSRLWAITVTAHASWDWRKPLLQTAFHALVHSKLDYAAPVWIVSKIRLYVS